MKQMLAENMLKKSTSAASLASLIFNYSPLPQVHFHNQTKAVAHHKNSTETKFNAKSNDGIIKPRSPHKNSVSSFKSLVAAEHVDL